MSQRPVSRIYASPFTARNQFETSTGFQTSKALAPGGTPGEVLGVGTDGKVGFINYGVTPSSSTANEGDIIIGDASGNESILPIGGAGEVLVSNGTTLAYSALGNTADSIITTRGDLIAGDASANAARVAVGADGQVFQSDGTDVGWAAPTATGSVVPSGDVDDVIVLHTSNLRANKTTARRAAMAADLLARPFIHTGEQTAVIAYDITNGTRTLNGNQASVISVADTTSNTLTMGGQATCYISGNVGTIRTNDATNAFVTSSQGTRNLVVNTGDQNFIACTKSSNGFNLCQGAQSFIIGHTQTDSGTVSANSARCGHIGCANSTALLNQNVIMCSTSRNRTAANRLEVDAMQAAGSGVTSDKAVKVFVRKNPREDEPVQADCDRLCRVETKEYRLKKMGRVMRGFDADELGAEYPEAMFSTGHETIVVKRKSALNGWEREDGTPISGEVEVDDDDMRAGYVYEERALPHKEIDPMAINTALWTTCKKQMQLINDLRARVDVLKSGV